MNRTTNVLLQKIEQLKDEVVFWRRAYNKCHQEKERLWEVRAEVERLQVENDQLRASLRKLLNETHTPATMETHSQLEAKGLVEYEKR